MSNKAFQKFIDKPASGAKKKEIIRQEKKKEKRERREAIEESKRKRFQNDSKKYEVRSKKYEVRNEKQEARSQKYKVPNKKQERENDNFDLRNTKSNFPLQKRNEFVQQAIENSKRVKAGYQLKNTKPERLKTKQSTTNFQSQTAKYQPATPQMPLNKFIAHCGICGRREAAELIKLGKVKVNNEVIFEPGFKVEGSEKISVNGKVVHLQKNLVYILLNKPKDYITTAKDPQGRKTVFDLLKGASGERLYPVGRLDRNTTGVLLITNDGELAQKLTHPSFQVKKIYEVTLDKPLIKADFDAILKGVILEDGIIAADALAYSDTKDKRIIGIEIHSGRNRIVRRMFEHLGYKIKNLDRVMFAGLTKKNVERSKWRYLSEKEIRLLKYLNQGFVKNK